MAQKNPPALSTKFPRSWILVIAGCLAVLAALLWTIQPVAVQAQCKGLSECKNCHEQQGQKPVGTEGAWHSDHQLYDFCSACHGGDPESRDAATAHSGLLLQLSGMPANCKACHAADLDEKYASYAAQLGVDTAIAPQPTSPAAVSGTEQNLGVFLGGKSALDVNPSATTASEAPTTANTAPAQSAGSESLTGNLIALSLLLVLLAGGGWAIARNERRLGNPLVPPRLARVWAWVRRESWSPYAAGVLLGCVCILSVLLTGHLLGASSGVATLASLLANAFAPTTAQANMYFKFVIPPSLNWELLLLIGIFCGGLAASLTAGTFHLRWNDDPTWRKVFGPQRWKRFLIGFLGAILIQYGAGLAGGCTSGLAISGGMLLAPSAFVFMAGMFLAGILVALLVYRRRY